IPVRCVISPPRARRPAPNLRTCSTDLLVLAGLGWTGASLLVRVNGAQGRLERNQTLAAARLSFFRDARAPRDSSSGSSLARYLSRCEPRLAFSHRRFYFSNHLLSARAFGGW